MASVECIIFLVRPHAIVDRVGIQFCQPASVYLASYNNMDVYTLSYILIPPFLMLPPDTWSDQPATGEKPPPVSSHTFTKIDHHRAVVFGGFTGRSELDDTYVLDMETWVCCQVYCGYTHVCT